MKNKFLIFLLVILSLLIGIVIFNRLESPKISDDASTNKIKKVSKNTLPPLDQIDTENNNLTPEMIEAYEEQKRQERNKIIEESVKRSNGPIEFYGKVIDQHGEPVSEAIIKANIRYWIMGAPGVPGSRHQEYELVTDKNGQFHVKGRTGDSLTIEKISKDGYKSYSGINKSFGPGKHTLVIFKMWKQQGAEKLIKIYEHYRIPYDGTPVVFNLKYGHMLANGSSGDLKVTLLRNPLKIKLGQRNYEWRATLEAINGGLIESNDEFMYLAPESGYQPKIEISMPANAPKWSATKKISFYQKTGSDYARVTVEFRTDSDREKTGFTIDSYLNPNGSRNLEYDSLVQNKR